MEGPDQEVKPLGGRPQKALGAIVQGAILPDFGWAHLGVTKEAAFLEPRPLNFSGLFYPQSGTAGILGLLVFNQLFLLHNRNFHEHINPVEQRSADALLVPGNGRRRATTFLGWVSVITVGAGVHGRQQHEAGGVGDTPADPADGDHFVFQRLAQGL